MNLLASCKVAVAALRVNALRSFLAMLGVIIGVASVIVMVSVASGASEAIEARIRALGTNLLVIQPGSFTSGGRRAGEGTATALSEGDLRVIRAKVPGVAAVAGVIQGSAALVFGASNWTTQVNGVNEDYLEVRDWPLVEGRNFSEAELKSGAKVAILGATAARELFGADTGIGEQIRVMNVPFTVIGLLAAKGQSGWGTDQDDLALVPVTTARRRLFGGEQTVPENLRSIMVEVASAEGLADAQAEIETILRERRRVRTGAPDDFRVRDMADVIRTRSETQSILSLLLGATAAISLIVGGIGIMNIMLVSVTERTREIGIRLAIGAREGDVLRQFLIEAMVLSVMGGLAGVVLGIACSMVAARLLGIPFVFDPLIVGVAIVFAAAIGIAFGYLPARRAARLDPIEALRHE